MQIEFTKKDSDTHFLRVRRADGSEASAELHTKTYLLHDLCHFGVEKQLRYEKGFWGMLAAGHAFDQLNGKQNSLTNELRFIEKIVGPVQSIVSGHLAAGDFAMSTSYLESDAARNLDVEQVVEMIQDLLRKWNRLPFGQSLILQFEYTWEIPCR